MRHVISVAVLVLALTACGDDGPSEEDRSKAETFCSSSMGFDRYEDGDAYDRCVDDAAKVAECLTRAGFGISEAPFVPSKCEGDKPIE